MKKILTIIALALLAANTFGQQSQKIRELEEFLIRHGFVLTDKHIGGGKYLYQHLSYSKTHSARVPKLSDTMSEEDVQLQRQEFDSINAIQRVAQEVIWDSIRNFVNELTPETSECYLHESHKDGKDTIRYTLRFSQSDGEIQENIQLRYFQGYRFNDDIYSVHSDFSYSFNDIHASNPDRAFDIDGFENYLRQVLTPILKKKGVKHYPIRWQYDESYPISQYNRDLYLHWNATPPSHVPQNGAATGTEFFIPKSQIDSTADFLRHIETEVVRYLQEHKDQRFTHDSRYEYSKKLGGNSMWDFGQVHEFVQSRHNLNETTGTAYALFSVIDDEGVHLLSLKHPVNALWIPKGFQKMKSWKNGKAKYRR